MIVINQSRDLIARMDDIQLKGAKITGVSVQHPMGVTLAKYSDKGRAQAVFLGLIQELKQSDACPPVLELPTD
jgi:hypothetical protein